MAAEQSRPANPRQTQRTNNVTEDPEPEDSTCNLFTCSYRNPQEEKWSNHGCCYSKQLSTTNGTRHRGSYSHHQCRHISPNTVRCTSTTAYSKNLVYLYRRTVEGPRGVTCYSNIPKPSCRSSYRADSGRWIRTKLIGRDWLQVITLNWHNINKVTAGDQTTLTTILQKHEPVF